MESRQRSLSNSDALGWSMDFIVNDNNNEEKGNEEFCTKLSRQQPSKNSENEELWQLREINNFAGSKHSLELVVENKGK